MVGRDITRYIKESEEKFNEEQIRPDETGVSYVIDRGFYERTPINDRFMRNNGMPDIFTPSINETLPTFQSVDAAGLIAHMVQSQEAPVRILDLGCGRGRALAEIEFEYGDRVSVRGITARRYSGSYLGEEEIRVGNINQLWKYAEQNYYDLIYSAFVLMHTSQHILDHAIRVYRHLKPGGIALLEASGAGEEFRHVNDFGNIQYWGEVNGYEIEYDTAGDQHSSDVTTIAFRRVPEHNGLLLPIKHEFDSRGAFKGVTFDPSNA